MELPKQFDNITAHVIDDMKVTLRQGSKVSMAAASFSIYAFEALQKELEKVDELRFIFTSPTFNKEREKKQKREFYIPKLNRERTLYGSDFEIKLRNNLTQRAIAKECADWIRQKVRFKTNVSQQNMPGFLNVENEEDLYTYMPFNEFTTTELGCERGNYDLIVIDESHNFRNGGKVTTDEDDENPRENRYLRLMNQVIRAGVRTKVLMLSATPVNNRFNDLKNQLQLAYEGKQDLINDKLNTDRPIEDIFRSAQMQYNAWSHIEDPNERTTEKLLDMLSFDFFQVLDAVTIARSRKHIEKYYDTTEIGKFPTRLRPISKRPKLTDLDDAITYKEIANQLDDLNLGVYAPSDYILPSKRAKYEIDIDERGKHLGMSGREKGLKKLMAINLLKRLESSVNSFRLTLSRMKEMIDETIEAIDNFLTTRQDVRLTVQSFDRFDVQSLERLIEDEEDDILIGGKKTKVALADMDCRSWMRDLLKDQEILGLLLVMIKDINPEHDSKLQMLIENLREKFNHPINGNNKKVIVFTAFSDTAQYLYDNLAAMIQEKTGLHVGLVTGNGIRSTVKGLPAEFNSVLTLFSPVSKEKDKLFPKQPEVIDVLIATDCISEGQNLQDCDYLINYDIHWNPVRIIQRFGRVDRIGSKNDVIQLVNYWPDIELDDYLYLKGRVEARMAGMDITAGGGGNVLLSNEEQTDLEYRKSQLMRLQEEVVDLEDMDTGINIMDLGLNEFRLDLLAYLPEHPDIEHTPFGMSAVVPASATAKPGVIFILKNRNNAVNIGHQNLLHPFYMVYLSDEGDTIINHLAPKRLLDIMRLACKGKHEPIVELCHQFNKETDNGRRMTHYSDLLQKAVATIVAQKEESDLESLFSFGETTALQGDIKGLDDFELICFLVIKRING